VLILNSEQWEGDVQVFLSHSKDRSRKVAEFFHENLPKVFQSVDTWFSGDAKCLPLGRYDHKRIVEAAKQSSICLLFLDEENITSPWISFEPGMFYAQEKEVMVFLGGGLTHSQLKTRNSPLEGYHAYPSTDSLFKLLQSINLATVNLEPSKFAHQQQRFVTDFIAEYGIVYS
jgi:hypothetical protein